MALTALLLSIGAIVVCLALAKRSKNVRKDDIKEIMTEKIVLKDIVGGFNLEEINSNFSKIETALNEKVLYRTNPSGQTNVMNQTLDMNGYGIINVGTINSGGVPVPAPVLAEDVVFNPVGSLEATNVQDAIEELMNEGGGSTAGVSSFNSRIGDVTLFDSDVNGALGYTPANIVSPSFSGTPTAPTASSGTSTTQIATTAFVSNAVASVSTGGIYVSVKAAPYNAVGNGVANDAAAIQAAINAVQAAGGGTVFFPRGTYNVGSSLNVNVGVGITLLGEDRKSTVIRTTSATSNLLTVSEWFVHIKSLGFRSSVTRTGGIFVDMQGAFNTIEDFDIEGDFIGIKMSGVGSRILNGVMGPGASGGKRIWATGGDTSQIISNCLIGSQVAPFPAYGIYVDSSAALCINNTSVIAQGVCLGIDPGAGQGVFSLYADNCFFDSAGTGLAIVTNGDGVAQRCNFNNCWFSSMSSNGISMVRNGTGDINGIHFDNCDVLFNALSGISLNTLGIKDINIRGSRIGGNTSHGIFINAGITDFSIIDNNIGTTLSPGGNGGWGVIIGAGASDRYIVDGNRFLNNTLGSVSDGGSGTNKRVTTGYAGGGGGGITALTGDVTASGTGSVTATLANSGVAAGSYGTAVVFPKITVDAKGRITSATTQQLEATNIHGIVRGKVTTPADTTGTVSVTFPAGSFTAPPVVVATAEFAGPTPVTPRIIGVSNITSTGCTFTAVNDVGGGMGLTGIYYIAIGG